MPAQLEMIDSMGAVRDTALLRRRMQADGYLFFSQLIEAERAIAVKQEIVSILREHHIIEDDHAPDERDSGAPDEKSSGGLDEKDSGAPDAMWSGGPQPTEAEYMAVYDRIVRLESFQQLARSRDIVAIVEALCGETVQVWEQQLIRIVYPDPAARAAQGVGAHQDGDPKLGYLASRFYTGWISLMQIDAEIGGLAVAPGSHRMGVLESAGNVASSTKDVRDEGYGLDSSDLPWATTEYVPGSAVVFSNFTAHRGLPNRSDRIRLSCDFRYQAAGDSASWLAHTLGPDVRRTAQQIDETLASRALYVTTRATPDVLGDVRRQMMEERSTTLARAQELVREMQSPGSVACR